MVTYTRDEIIDKIAASVVINRITSCWEWQKYRHFGYGKININGRVVRASRLSYSVFCGEIPDGLHVLHRCDNPACVNPTHLYAGTGADNARDRVERGRGHDQRGACGPLSKITNQQSREIRSLAASGAASHRSIAKMFGVSHTAIDYIVNGRTFKNTLEESNG